MSKQQRDYGKQPNRFTFKLLHNGAPVTTTDQFGSKKPIERNFDAPFDDPQNLLNRFPKGFISRGESVMDKEKFANIFQHSWEAVEMGDQIAEIFRLALKNSTSKYLYDLNRTERSMLFGEVMSIKDTTRKIKTKSDVTQEYAKFSDEKNVYSKKQSKYSFVIIDKQSPIRDDQGQYREIRELRATFDELNEKKRFNKFTPEDEILWKLTELKMAQNFCEKEIFRHEISANDFSFTQDFAPPILTVWKDFNVNFASVDGNQETEDISNFSKISGQAQNIRAKIARMKEYVLEVEKTGDNIKVASIEKDIRKYESELSSLENISFAGIRTLIKQYFNLGEYHNKYLNAPEDRFNNYYMNSSQAEIWLDQIALVD